MGDADFVRETIQALNSHAAELELHVQEGNGSGEKSDGNSER